MPYAQSSRLHIAGTFLALTVLSVGGSGSALAQDSRKVVEPVVPPICAALAARHSTPEETDHTLDTDRIQKAIASCPAGQAVRLAAGGSHQAFVSGPLELASGVTLLIDAGVTLYATTNPRAYDLNKKVCGTNDAHGRGCLPFIIANRTHGSGIMGEGTIDGQGGHLIDGKPESWWQIARRAQKENTRQNVPRLIEINRSTEFTLYRITLRNSPNFHVTLNQVDGFTAWGVRLDTPHDARNTDGIDPISSRNVTVAHSYLRTGDDNIAIKAGHNGKTENISVLHNHFYNGHGMSIGSETDGGVSNVLVEDLSMDGATSGLRIKSDPSRGGPVNNIVYRNVCLRNIRAPLDLDTHYDPKAKGGKIPVYGGIRFEHVRGLTPGKIIMRGFDADNPLTATLDDVVIDGNSSMQMAYAKLTLGPGPVQPVPAGMDVQVAGTPATGPGLSCESRFAPFPEAKATATGVTRPQLTPSQASAYAYREVLKYAGTIGNETVDPWDPLNDPLATGALLKPDYVVDAAADRVAKNVFRSIQAAVSAAVNSSVGSGRKDRIYIQIKPGTYRELVYVPAAPAPITLYGSDPDATKTRISAELSAGTSGETYANRFGAQFATTDPAITAMYASLKDRSVVGTPGSTIAWVKNDGFQARNITFENAYNRSRHEPVREVPAAIAAQQVVIYNQAVAMMVEGADKVQFENVRFLGFQDTLFLTSLGNGKTVRSFFNKSYIEGDTDFIFGDATAYFYQSEIKSLGERKNISYATAPNTNLRSKFGFVFNACKFTHDGTPNALAGKFFLGRQWFRSQKCTPFGKVTSPANYSCRVDMVDGYEEPAGTITKGVLETVGKVIVMNSQIGVHIDSTRPWSSWNKDGARQFRPAQYSSDDFWNNLLAAKIDPVRQLGYTAKQDPAEPFLAEFNNTDE